MFKLFSERNKKANEVDIYSYDNLPTPFRNQLFYITEEAINRFNELIHSSDINLWERSHYLFCKEKGIKAMGDGYSSYRTQIETYIDVSSDLDVLDFIDFEFHYFYFIAGRLQSATEIYEDAISELNYRFQQHKLGYEFTNGSLIRIDNMVIHHEYIKPALNLLHANGFDGAEEEYIKAFESLRKSDYKNAIIEAEKAFESTMKTICEKNGYQFDPERDAARKLLSVLKANQFFPSYLESHLDAIVSTLETGAPVVRNRTSGHGQGSDIIGIPDSYAKYVIGLVAVNIVFLVQLLSE